MSTSLSGDETLHLDAGASSSIMHIVRAIAMLIVTTAPLRAQSGMLPAFVPQCPAGSAPVVDSSIVTVQISPGVSWRTREYDAAERTRILSYADAIRQHFVPPVTLGVMPMLGVLSAREDRRTSEAGAHAAVSGRLVLVVSQVGRLTVQAWETRPLSAAFAAAVTRAVIVADSLGAFADMPPVGPTDGDTLALNITTRVHPAEGDPMLMRAQIPAYAASQGAAVKRQIMPKYPETARASDTDTDNDGRIRFIVGSDGRAVASSVQVTRTDFSDFSEPMRQTVINGTYRAGTSGGCTVPMAVMQDFKFRSGSP